tara:strand:- start:17 stop:625 length:609 start_codon:yes stop_codon:yes gene_type:complete
MLIVDNLLKDKKMISALKDDKIWENFPSLNWWDGWWKTKPRNIMELLIEIIWKKYVHFETAPAGFEYWSNVHTADKGLGWHVDKDEKYYAEKKRYKMPNSGHIYYVESENVEGGYLELSNLSNEVAPDPDKVEKIRPVENRLVMFNPSLPHRVSKVDSGKRRAFLANVWTNKPSTFDTSENVKRYDRDTLKDVFWPNKFNLP